MTRISSIYGNIRRTLPAKSTSDVRVSPVTPVTSARRVGDAVSDTVARIIASEGGLIGSVRSGLLSSLQAATMGRSALGKIEGIIHDLRQAVLTQSQRPAAETQRQIGVLLGRIDLTVGDATLSGTNLIRGTTGGEVRATQVVGLDAPQGGRFVPLGGSGHQAMNATASGLGLLGFNPNGSGASLQLGLLKALSKSQGDGDRTLRGELVIQTSNYGKDDAETPEMPGKQWVFQAGLGIKPGLVEHSHIDHDGNLRRLESEISVPLVTGASDDDAIEAVSRSLRRAGFEVSGNQGTSISIAGNNLHPQAVVLRLLRTPDGAPEDYRGPMVVQAEAAAGDWYGVDAALGILDAARRRVLGIAEALGRDIARIEGLDTILAAKTEVMLSKSGVPLEVADIPREKLAILLPLLRQQISETALPLANNSPHPLIWLVLGSMSEANPVGMRAAHGMRRVVTTRKERQVDGVETVLDAAVRDGNTLSLIVPRPDQAASEIVRTDNAQRASAFLHLSRMGDADVVTEVKAIFDKWKEFMGPKKTAQGKGFDLLQAIRWASLPKLGPEPEEKERKPDQGQG